jgi:hypothetical protein
MTIFRRKDCIHTASGIFALCKRLHSTQVESGLQTALNLCTVQTFKGLRAFVANERVQPSYTLYDSLILY